LRVRYRCAVKGKIRLKEAFDISSGLITYDFEGGPDGELKFIGATASVPDSSMWPVLRPNPEEGIALEIEMKSPFFDLIRKNLRSAESLLSLFGMESIDTENAEEVWLPDSEEERQLLKLFGFRRTKEKLSPKEWPYIQFDIVARAILAAEDAYETEAALSFFRKGNIDMAEERFLEALMDFLFMIESLFARGKIKSAHVEAEYSKNEVLQSCVMKTLSDNILLESVKHDERIRTAYQADYFGKSVQQITKRLISLRGFIHHHSCTNKEIWHPDDHIRFGADSYFLQYLCYHVGFELGGSKIFSEDHVATYIALHNEALKKARTKEP
jgi:hypothetical protein